MRLVIPTVVALTLILSCSDSHSKSHDQARASSAPQGKPRLSPADEAARDRALTMQERGRRCDAAPTVDLESCRIACKLNHSNSCGWLGEAARRDGDEAAAKRYFESACRGGSGIGCEGLGRYREARTVYRVHCSQHHAASCSRLARLYEKGLGGAVSLGAAAAYREKACILGIKSDCP